LPIAGSAVFSTLNRGIMITIMASIRPLLVVLMLALGAMPARAAEAVYPPGSRIGLAPPAGLVTSKSFFGYEDPDNDVAIMLLAMPADAYAELDRTMNAEALQRQGVTFEAREAVPLSSGKGFVVVGHQEANHIKLRKWFLVASASGLTALVTVQVPVSAAARYPDAAIRDALATLTVRATVPVEEQLGLLPFKVSELAGFRVAGVMPGRAVMLSDTPADQPRLPPIVMKPQILIAVAPGGPTQSSDREAFARDLFATVPNLKDARIVSSEPLRINGQQGHEILANGQDLSGTVALTVVQWVRFGGGAYLQMVGTARADGWKDAYPRFRSVRDGIDPR
jgi:hypothetical protein